MGETASIIMMKTSEPTGIPMYVRRLRRSLGLRMPKLPQLSMVMTASMITRISGAVTSSET